MRKPTVASYYRDPLHGHIAYEVEDILRREKGTADDFSNSPRQRYRNPRSFAETIFLAGKDFGQCRLSGSPTAALNTLSSLHGDEHEFRLDAGNQTEISITMQKGHARKNGVRRYQAVVRRSRCYARPSTSRIQMRCAARCFSSVGRDYHWQLAEYPIPASETVRVICALENLL
jgi:hypothetical protein